MGMIDMEVKASDIIVAAIFALLFAPLAPPVHKTVKYLWNRSVDGVAGSFEAWRHRRIKNILKQVEILRYISNDQALASRAMIALNGNILILALSSLIAFSTAIAVGIVTSLNQISDSMHIDKKMILEVTIYSSFLADYFNVERGARVFSILVLFAAYYMYNRALSTNQKMLDIVDPKTTITRLEARLYKLQKRIPDTE